MTSMAISRNFLLFSASLLFFIVSPSIQASLRPKALVLPVLRDDSTLQYVTQIKQRTPLVSVKLTLDLGGDSVCVDCENDYVSSSYSPVGCKSAPCKLAFESTCGDCDHGHGPKPGCNNYTCNLFPSNNVKYTGTVGEVAQDVVSVQSTDGKNPGKFVSVPKFPFTCGWSFLVDGLAGGVKGVAGLGRTKISMPSLFSAAFKFPRKFAICLSSFNGIVFFGDGPYTFLPNIDISKSLIYTPLILNPTSIAPSSFRGEPSSEYFIGVKGIKINDKPVRLNKTLLSIRKKTGHGGTKISTVTPYTTMETSIYKAVVKAFMKQIPRVARVPAVAPFAACLNDNTYIDGPIPRIDLVLQNNVVWKIFGSNSMVQINNNVSCLGFVDGGSEPRTSIVIGGIQLENNLVQIDLEGSRIGFTPTNLLFNDTSCSLFNDTSIA